MAAAQAAGGGDSVLLPRLMALELHSVLFCAFVTWMEWHYPAGPGGPTPLSESARGPHPAQRAGTALHRVP